MTGYKTEEFLIKIGENEVMHKYKSKYYFQRDLIVEVLNLAVQEEEKFTIRHKIMNPNIEDRDLELMKEKEK